jgi:hypothetical protein
MPQRYDQFGMSLLMLAAVLAVWLGIDGPFITDASTKGWYEVLKDWQTLIGVIAAFIVGYMAVLPVWRQVKETQRQAAGAAIIPLMKTAETLEEERKVVFDARQAMDAVPPLTDDYENADYHQIYQKWPEEAYTLRQKVDSFRQQLQQHTDRHPDARREIDRLRRATLRCIKLLYDEIGTMSRAFAQQTGGLAPEDGDEELPSAVLKGIGGRVIDAHEGFEQFAWQLEIALGEEIPRVWSRVRELERAAVG